MSVGWRVLGYRHGWRRQSRSLPLAGGQGGYRARDVGLGGRLVDTKAGERTCAVLEFQQLLELVKIRASMLNAFNRLSVTSRKPLPA